MNGVLQPFDVPSCACQEILQPAARQAAATDDVGSEGTGRPRKYCMTSRNIGTPVIVDSQGIPVGMQFGRLRAAMAKA